MIIGVPKEIKNNENRVGMTPSGVAEVVKQGHRVFIQHTAGVNSGFPDEAYQAVGAHVLPTIEDIYATAEMIVKVKEPIVTEYNLIRKGQLLFTYFHFASDKELTLAMLSNKSICLAYETVEEADHSLPLLIPMSEVAGRMSIQEGARFLEKPQGGKGILLGGVPGVKPAKVLILGGGVVGSNAAQMAAGMGADVTITDINLYTELVSDHPIDLCRYQVANGYMGRVGLINSGGESHGTSDLHDAVVTAVVNKRAGGMGLICGRKAFQKTMKDGVSLLNTIQDVYLDPSITVA